MNRPIAKFESEVLTVFRSLYAGEICKQSPAAEKPDLI